MMTPLHNDDVIDDHAEALRKKKEAMTRSHDAPPPARKVRVVEEGHVSIARPSQFTQRVVTETSAGSKRRKVERNYQGFSDSDESDKIEDKDLAEALRKRDSAIHADIAARYPCRQPREFLLIIWSFSDLRQTPEMIGINEMNITTNHEEYL